MYCCQLWFNSSKSSLKDYLPTTKMCCVVVNALMLLVNVIISKKLMLLLLINVIDNMLISKKFSPFAKHQGNLHIGSQK